MFCPKAKWHTHKKKTRTKLYYPHSEVLGYHVARYKVKPTSLHVSINFTFPATS